MVCENSHLLMERTNRDTSAELYQGGINGWRWSVNPSELKYRCTDCWSSAISPESLTLEGEPNPSLPEGNQTSKNFKSCSKSSSVFLKLRLKPNS